MSKRLVLVLTLSVTGLSLLLWQGNSFTPSSDVEMRVDSSATRVAHNQLASAQRKEAAASAQTSTLSAQSSPVEEPFPHAEFNLFERVPLNVHSDTEHQHRKPAHEWLDPSVGINQLLAAANRSDRGWVYGWIQLEPSVARDEFSALAREQGLEVETIDGSFAVAKFPAFKEAIQTVADYKSVVGVGIQPNKSKVTGRLSRVAQTPSQEIPVFITLMARDSNGNWRRELENQGVVVGDWLAEIRTYAANVRSDLLVSIAENDFVASIEPLEGVHSLLDSAVPTMGVDALRSYRANQQDFSGFVGSNVPVGVVDTGLNISHPDLATNRASICGSNFFPNLVDGGDGDLDLWSDYGGHGSHVTGIIAGNGALRAEFAGIAPGVQHLRIAKVLSRDGIGSELTVAQGVRYLTRPTSCTFEGEMSSTVRPLVVNLSIGGPGSLDGRGSTSRNIDSIVWNSNQVLIFAAGNSGQAGTSHASTVKNVLSVGAITDAGEINSFSSHGPTSDGRLNPHIVATGSHITSAKGNGSTDEYVTYSGTSMAAPTVAGVVALLMDSDPEYQNNPAYVKARLLANAVKPSDVLGTAVYPLNNSSGPGQFNYEYGLGLVAAQSLLQDGVDGAWRMDGDSGTLSMGEGRQYEITIPLNTSRLDIALNWVEQPVPLIQPTTVAANLDLYLDQHGDCAELDCGEYSSTSKVDSVEWLIVKDPEPGVYKIKITPANEFADAVRVGIAWNLIANSDRPRLAVEPMQQNVAVRDGESFSIDLQLSADSYIAAGTTLHMVCKSEHALGCTNYQDRSWHFSSSVERLDNTTAMVEAPIDAAITIGEVAFGKPRNLKLIVPRGIVAQSHSLHFVASSWTAESSVGAVAVEVEGSVRSAPPVPPVNDSVKNALVLNGSTGQLAVDLALATREPGEVLRDPLVDVGEQKKFFANINEEQRGFDPEMQGFATQKSIWYKLEPAETGPVYLSIAGENLDAGAYVSVFKGSSPSRDMRIAQGELDVHFLANADQSYLLQLSLLDASAYPSQFSWQQAADLPPANDDFDDRFALVGTSGTHKGSNYKASLESFEFYGAGVPGASTWFRWVAPESGTYAFSVSEGFWALVFDGSDPDFLRRVSGMPNWVLGTFGYELALGTEADAEFFAAANQEYQIVVVESNEDSVLYDLEWRKTESFRGMYAPNDMIEAAEPLEETAGRIEFYGFLRGTVEPNEPVESGFGTVWYRWRPETSGRYLFRLLNAEAGKLALFERPASGWTLIQDGQTLRVQLRQNTEYWLSVGYRMDSMFVDFDGSTSAEGFEWGRVPVNDSINSASQLTGVRGTITSNHAFASNSDHNHADLRAIQSLWWNWRAQSNGWQNFELANYEVDRQYSPETQGIIAVYRTEADGSLKLLADSDQSFLASGRAEAIVRSEQNRNYVVQVAHRATNLEQEFPELTFSYAPVDAPIWQHHVGKLTEYVRDNRDLSDPAFTNPLAVEIDELTGTVAVAMPNELRLYTGLAEGNVSRHVAVDYRYGSGNTFELDGSVAMAWDNENQTLYLVHSDGIDSVRVTLVGSPNFDRCISLNGDGLQPTQLETSADKRFFYAVGDGRIDIYERTGRCGFDLLQVLCASCPATEDARWQEATELATLRSVVYSSSDSSVYVGGEAGLERYRIQTDGTLRLVPRSIIDQIFDDFGFGLLEETSTAGGSVAIVQDEYLFWVANESVRADLYQIGSGLPDAAPELLASLSGFFFSEDGFDGIPYSHVSTPHRSNGCTSSAANTPHIAISVFCDDQVVTVAWDQTAGELYVSDWFQVGQPDRFNERLPDGLQSINPARLVHDRERARSYVLGDSSIGTLYLFKPASEITSDPY